MNTCMYIIFPCQTTLTVHIPGTHLPRTEHWLPKVHLMPRPIELFHRPCLCYQLQSIEQNMYVLL